MKSQLWQTEIGLPQSASVFYTREASGTLGPWGSYLVLFTYYAISHLFRIPKVIHHHYECCPDGCNTSSDEQNISVERPWLANDFDRPVLWDLCGPPPTDCHYFLTNYLRQPLHH